MSEEEIVQSEQQEQAPEAQEQQQDIKNEVAEEKTQPKKNDKEYNFAELRRQKDDFERRFYEEQRRSTEILELTKRLQGTQNQEQRDLLEEELSKLSPEDLATVGNAEKIYAKHHKPTKKKIDEMEAKVAQLEQALDEQRFRAKFPDLDDVITSENIELLKNEDPDIADMLSKMPQGSKEQVTMAYKYIKRILPEKVADNGEKKKAIENSKKPVSIQALAKQSPIGIANAFADGSLTKETKAAYYKEMQDAIKRG